MHCAPLQVESATALSSLQQSLASFRCVLHDQLAAELAVGQATLQLFAANQRDWQRRQPQPDQQYTHEQMVQLQRQLQECHLSAFLGQHSSSGCNSSSSSGGGDGPASAQDQQLVLLVCSLLAWPLVVMSPTLFDAAYPGLHQHQQQHRVGGTATHTQPFCTAQVCQLLHAAVAGIGPEGSSSNLSPRSEGIRGVLLKALNLGVAPEQQQQQQQQDPQKGAQQDPQQLLLSWLLQLLVQQWEHPPSSSSSAGSQQQGDSTTAANGRSGSAAAATCGVEGCCDPVAGVQLAAFTRGLCNLLLLRLLSRAPSCESWSWEACLAVTQLMVSSEQAAGAAGGLLYQAVTLLQTFGIQEALVDPMEQQQADTPRPGPYHNNSSRQAELQAFADQLLTVLQQLQQAEEALLVCTNCDSSSSSSGSRSARSLHRALHSTSNNSRIRSRSRSNAWATKQHQQQQQQLHGFGVPTFWRSQLLSQYRDTRKDGYSWVQKYFSDVAPGNCKPGFWGLVSHAMVCFLSLLFGCFMLAQASLQLERSLWSARCCMPVLVSTQSWTSHNCAGAAVNFTGCPHVPSCPARSLFLQLGKFAAADQLNLRHAEAPTALAAAPSTVQLQQDPGELAQGSWQAQQAILAKQLARTANMQLRHQVRSCHRHAVLYYAVVGG
jgi:hypothetical protein